MCSHYNHGNERLAAMLACLGDGVLAMNIEKKIEYINAAAQKILGCREAEALGQYCDEVLRVYNADSGEPITCPVDVAFNGHDISGLPHNSAILAANGAYKYISATFSPIRVQGACEGVIAVIRDITWQKTLEKDAAAAVESMTAMFNASPIGMYLIDGERSVAMANSAAMELLSVNSTLLPGRRLGDEMLCEGSIEQPNGCGSGAKCSLCPLNNAIREALAGTSSQNIEFKGTYILDGRPTPRWFHCGVTPVFLDRRSYALVSLEDITDRKQAEAEREKTAGLYKALFNTATDACYLHELVMSDERVSRIVEVNDILCKRLGYSREELIGMDIVNLNKEKSWAFYTGLMKEICIKSHYTYNARHLTKTGSEIPVEVNAHYLEMEGKVYIFSLARDITERIRADQQIEESRAKYQALLMNMNAGFGYFQIITDKHNNPLDCLTIEANKALENFLGVAGLAGTSVSQHAPTVVADLRDRVLPIAISGTGELFIEELYVSALQKWASLYIYSLQPSYFAVLLNDTTEVKRAKEQLLRAKDAAEAASKAESEFLANMSHEIRTPINGIVGMIELTMLTSLDGEQRENLSTARSCADALLNIINDILDFSKLEAGKLKVEQAPFELRTLMEELLRTHAIAASSKGVKLSYSLSSSLPAYLVGDAHRLGQVLNNLINNAIKFTEQGEVNVTIKKTGAAFSAAELLFSVSDTGQGISHDGMTRLFKSFSQVDSSYTRKHGGTGLGLAICKQLVELMGGSIWAESEVGRGSTFSFTVPFMAGERPTALHTAMKAKAPTFCANILLVEDDKVNQIVLSRMLTQLGHNVEIADNGAQAVSNHLQKQYDVIFMDIQMPTMDGIEATRIIRARERLVRTPIIALTAFALPGDKEHFLTMGMDDYLPKPVKSEDLRAVLARVHRKGGLYPVLSAAVDAEGELVLRPVQPCELDNCHKSRQEIECVMSALHAAVVSTDFAQVEKQANTLRNLFRSVGAEELKTSAFKIELAARRENLPQVVERTHELQYGFDIYNKYKEGVMN